MSSSSNTRVYVGRLNRDVRERDLEKFFRDYGKIRDVNMKNGYAFVNFEDHRDADDAVYELDGKEILGDKVLVEFTRGTSSRDRRAGGDFRGEDRGRGGGGDFGRGSYGSSGTSFSLFERPFNTKHRVIVEGLSSSTDWRDLKDFFRRVAEVTFADAHRFKTGEGVADFKSKDDMKRVIRELDDTKLNGRRVRLTEDTQQQRPSRSRSRSPRRKSRSRSPRRAKSRERRSRSMSADYKEADTFEAKSQSRSRSRTPTEDVITAEEDKK